MTYDVIANGLDYLTVQTWESSVIMFWFLLFFELPHYALCFAMAAFLRKPDLVPSEELRPLGRVSMIIAGHNEADTIEACVRNLWEQSLPPDEIVIVSDGSNDTMKKKIAELLHAGLIHNAHSTNLRAGKAAATNLAARLATGDILINVDSDCRFDRHAIRQIVQPFQDPRTGAVAGNILVRNYKETGIAALQAVEYLISISLGKTALDMLDQVTCASGAFSAFRTSALKQVGWLDAGGGEDLDVSLRLRRAGWRVAFAPAAIAYTVVPATLSVLTRQRFRWERDAVRLRYRKHLGFLNPFSPHFSAYELFHEFEFLLFNVVGAAMLPVYFVWLFLTYGEFALIILISAQAVLSTIDVVIFLLAIYATPKAPALALLPYLPGFTLFNSIIMRMIRLTAYLQEWIFKASYRDAYVPDKVHKVRE